MIVDDSRGTEKGRQRRGDREGETEKRRQRRGDRERGQGRERLETRD